MATYEAHLDQANSNLDFLIFTNTSGSTKWDWQITTAFYTAVHLVNAHLAKTANLHFRTHNDVKVSITPNPGSPTQLPSDVYLCYAKLENLSRRARYLCSDNPADRSVAAFLTYDKHFAKAIKNLDKLLKHFIDTYGLTFKNLPIKCADLNKNSPLFVFSLAA